MHMIHLKSNIRECMIIYISCWDQILSQQWKSKLKKMMVWQYSRNFTYVWRHAKIALCHVGLSLDVFFFKVYYGDEMLM